MIACKPPAAGYDNTQHEAGHAVCWRLGHAISVAAWHALLQLLDEAARSGVSVGSPHQDMGTGIAFYIAHASAWRSAEGLRCFQAGLVVAPWSSAETQADTCPK